MKRGWGEKEEEKIDPEEEAAQKFLAIEQIIIVQATIHLILGATIVTIVIEMTHKNLIIQL